MKYYGITCEFNPFHTGHKYLIEQIKSQTNAEGIVCVMSGSMVQRGDIAIYDKWTRAKAALENGADLVIELPVCYVLQSADVFAMGAVSILSSLGCSGIAFGSECTDTNLLKKIADIKTKETQEFKISLKNALNKGMGYPAAYESALNSILREISPNACMPNATLGVCYMAALNKINPHMDVHVVERIGDYHSKDISGSFASATAIRQNILSGDKRNDFSLCTSDKIYDINVISPLILGFFRMKTPEELTDIAGMEPGLAARLTEQSRISVTLEEFVANCTTKRYTSHRIRRVILCSLLGITDAPKPSYARVLALNSTGAAILKEIKENSEIEVINKITNCENKNSQYLKQDILSTDIAALCVNEKASRDFTNTPVVT